MAADSSQATPPAVLILSDDDEVDEDDDEELYESVQGIICDNSHFLYFFVTLERPKQTFWIISKVAII